MDKNRKINLGAFLMGFIGGYQLINFIKWLFNSKRNKKK